MRLTVVGCSGSYPGPDSPASCYLVEHDHEGRTWRIVLDMGNGALGALHRYADPLSIDAVLLSHLHADHCIDMASYYVLRKYHPSGAQPPIPVYGPKGTSRRLAKAYDLPKRPGMREEFSFHSYPGRSIDVGPFTITPVPVDHPVPAYGLRIEAGGQVLAYSGDTAPTEALLDIAADADLFLCEAAFRDSDDNPPGVHLTGSEAGQFATKAHARRLVITHIPPWHDAADALREARTSYDGDVTLATSGATHSL